MRRSRKLSRLVRRARSWLTTDGDPHQFQHGNQRLLNRQQLATFIPEAICKKTSTISSERQIKSTAESTEVDSADLSVIKSGHL